MSARKTLRKSALALAIASVSLSAYSVEINLSKGGEPHNFTEEEIAKGLNITGSTNFQAKVGEQVLVNIENAEVEGVVTNQGTIKITQDVDSVGTAATAIKVSSAELHKPDIETSTWLDPDTNEQLKFSYPVDIGGINNKGKIELTGANVTGIHSTNSSMGKIENTGTIIAKGETARGIHVNHNSAVDEIENYGTISVESSNKVTANTASSVPSGAIVVENSILRRVEEVDDGNGNLGGIHYGYIDNEETGVINATGANVSGIFVDKSTVAGVFNDGKIITTNGATAIKIKDSKIDHLIGNEGTIEASGDGAAGIYLQKVKRFVDSDLSVPGYESADSPVYIDNYGTITATDGAVAIKAVDTNAILNWFDGRIDGDIEGVSISEINHNVMFGGSNLESELILIGSNYIFGDAPKSTTVSFTQAHTTLTTKSGAVDYYGAPTDGGLRVAEGSRLAVEISGKTDAAKAIIAVDGSAEFGEGSGINVSSATGLTLDGKDYILLSTTGELTDKGLDVTGTSLLKVNSYEVKEGQITANVSVESSQAIVDAVVAAGGNKNSQAVAQELNSLIAAIPDGTALKDALIKAGTSPTALASAVEQLSPEVSGAGVQAAATGQTIITGATGARTSSLRGKSSGEALKETGVWVQTLYSDARQGTRDGIKGYNAYSSGLAIGADGKPTDDVTVGVAYSYLNTTVNGKSNSSTDVKGHAFTLYGGYEQGNYFVDGNLTYSTNSNDSTRNVLGTKAKGSYDSDMLGASVTGGYTFNLDNNFVVEPLVAARYANIKIDSFTEKGSPAALRTGSQRYEIAELGLGARASTSYAVGRGTLEPQVQVMALHDFAADQTKSTSAFVAAGNPFTVSGAKPVRNSYEASVGADYRLGALTFGANYGYTGKKGYNADTFSAKVRYDF